MSQKAQAHLKAPRRRQHGHSYRSRNIQYITGGMVKIKYRNTGRIPTWGEVESMRYPLCPEADFRSCFCLSCLSCWLLRAAG